MAPLKIAIIGAGVGGPAAAIGLARNGHEVTLYERAASIEGVGFAFRITPNSDRCLTFLGIDILASGGVAADWSRFMTCEGRMFAEVQENNRPEEKGISAFAYRTGLQKQLMDEAANQGAQIKMGAEVTSVDVAGCIIRFADGSTSSFDLVIGADGVHSCIRPYLVDSSIYFPRTSTGDSCLRATAPCQAVRDDPITSHIIDDKFRLSGWRAEDRLVIGYVVDHGKHLNLVCTHPEELSKSETSSGDDAEKTSYNQKISLETAKNIYKDFDKVVVRLLELADPGGFRVWKLLDMDDLPRWSKDRVVLMGDACHPVLPFGYSGASMAIEDAITLTVLLPSDVEPAQVQDRLQLFERIRRARVYRVRDESRKRSAGTKTEAGLREYRNFLSAHDAVEHAEQELKKHQELVS